MAIFESNKHGGNFLEFQFCKTNEPIKNDRVAVDLISHWKIDSLYITDEDFSVFFKLYKKLFDVALFPNGDTGFFVCGVNYYNKKQSKIMFESLSESIEEKYKEFVPWLSEAQDYNGFYILGI